MRLQYQNLQYLSGVLKDIPDLPFIQKKGSIFSKPSRNLNVELNASIKPAQLLPESDNMKTRSERSDLIESIGTASANSAKFRGIRPRMYIEDLLW